MRTSIRNIRRVSAETYARPLLSLDEGVRVEIMHILLNSISGDDERAMKKPARDLYSCFKGLWGDESADSYCRELREGISEPKEVESW